MILEETVEPMGEYFWQYGSEEGGKSQEGLR